MSPYGWLVCVGQKEPQPNRRVEIKEGTVEFLIGRRESCNLRYDCLEKGLDSHRWHT